MEMKPAPAEEAAVVAENAVNETANTPKKKVNFFTKRSICLLIAVILGIVAIACFSSIINGRINTANEKIEESKAETDPEKSGGAVGEGLANIITGAALIPALILCVVATLLCLIGWLFKQGWAGLVGGIFFGIALLCALLRFYLTLPPMILAIIGYNSMKKKAASEK